MTNPTPCDINCLWLSTRKESEGLYRANCAASTTEGCFPLGVIPVITKDNTPQIDQTTFNMLVCVWPALKK